MSLITFTVPGATTPQQATELVTSLRNICDFQKITSGQDGTVEVRAPQAMLAACTKLLRQLTSDRPQVSLDVQVYQISHNFTQRNRDAHPEYVQYVQHSGGSAGGAGRTEHLSRSSTS